MSGGKVYIEANDVITEIEIKAKNVWPEQGFFLCNLIQAVEVMLLGFF